MSNQETPEPKAPYEISIQHTGNGELKIDISDDNVHPICLTMPTVDGLLRLLFSKREAIAISTLLDTAIRTIDTAKNEA